MKQVRRQTEKKLGRRSRAFTIVELMVVVAVIGTLAGITIVGYGSWRARTAKTEVKSDLINLKAGMEEARNRNNGYPVYTAGTQFNGANSTKSVFKQSENVTLTYNSGSATTYCVTATSLAVPSVSMYVNLSSSNKNPQDGTC